MLRKEDSVLVIIDIQGKLATLMHQKDEFFANVVRMIKGAKLLGIPILWNEQVPDKLGKTQSAISEHLTDSEPLVKKSFSCCGNEDFVRRLESLNRKQVLLVGMETHICVYQTAIELLPSGYEVFVVADAVSSRKPENIRIRLDAMKDAGARITSVEMALFEMFDIAEGDQFRKMVDVVK